TARRFLCAIAARWLGRLRPVIAQSTRERYERRRHVATEGDEAWDDRLRKSGVQVHRVEHGIEGAGRQEVQVLPVGVPRGAEVGEGAVGDRPNPARVGVEDADGGGDRKSVV